MVQPHIHESANFIMCIYTLLLHADMIYMCLGMHVKEVLEVLCIL